MTVDNTSFLSTEQLADRYGLSIATIYQWRVRGYGPPYYSLDKSEVPKDFPRVRYQLHDLLAWEEANNITPINSF